MSPDLDNPLYWHGKEPVVEFPRVEWPWRQHGAFDSTFPLMFLHRTLFLQPDPRSVIMMHDPKATHAWWDGSCLVTALVKCGPCALVLYRGGGR